MEFPRCLLWTIGGFDQLLLELGVVRSVREGVEAQVVGLDVQIVLVQDDHVAIGHIPEVPDIDFGIVLEKGKVAASDHLVVARVIASLVDADQLKGEVRSFCFELLLHFVEVAILATAGASSRVGEIPSRDCFQVIPR